MKIKVAFLDFKKQDLESNRLIFTSIIKSN